jgi:Putative zinc-finger
MREQPHVDVAAYALGALDPDDDEAFRAHLDTCQACWAELESMVDVTSQLATVDPADILAEPEQPGPHVLEGLLAEVRTSRRHRRYQMLVAAAAAVVLIIAAPILATRLANGGKEAGPPVAQPPAAATVVHASNPASGVSASVGMERKAWGTQVSLQLSGVRGPLECELIAVSRNGEEQVVTTWSVPPKGYGVTAHPQPLVTQGGAALFPDEIGRFEVRTLDSRQELVRVPVKT